MSTYYKAVRPDGTDFYTGKVQWAPPEDHDGEWVVTHPGGVMPSAVEPVGMADVLCVSSEPADCTGFSWPCRLLEVQPVEGTGFHHYHDNKYRGTQFRVVGELPAWRSFGPNGEQVVAFLKVLEGLTPRQLHAARDAARGAAWDAAWETARDAAWGTAWKTAWDAARGTGRDAALDAVLAYVARDLIPEEQFEVLVQPFREAGVALP